MADSKITLSKEQVKLIEELAAANERMGMQPAWAKILALLTVSDETELTFDQILVTLNLSKSAVSQSLKQLQLLRKIGYKTRIGDRKRYFHVMFTDWKAQLAETFSAMGNLIEVNKNVLAKRNPKTKNFNNSLTEQNNFLTTVYEKVISELMK